MDFFRILRAISWKTPEILKEVHLSFLQEIDLAFFPGIPLIVASEMNSRIRTGVPSGFSCGAPSKILPWVYLGFLQKLL